MGLAEEVVVVVDVVETEEVDVVEATVLVVDADEAAAEEELACPYL